MSHVTERLTMNNIKLTVVFMNENRDIGKRLYTVQAPDYGYAKAFVMAELAINGLQALEITGA